MPGLDQTGPQGEGPMTGGGFGRCNSNSGSAAPISSYGVGRGGRPRGGGRGRCFGGGGGRGRNARPGRGRRWPAGSGPREAEADDLKVELRALTEEVGHLRNQLDECKSSNRGQPEG